MNNHPNHFSDSSQNYSSQYDESQLQVSSSQDTDSSIQNYGIGTHFEYENNYNGFCCQQSPSYQLEFDYQQGYQNSSDLSDTQALNEKNKSKSKRNGKEPVKHWDEKTSQMYKTYLRDNFEVAESEDKNLRKKTKFFVRMSHYIGSKSVSQCKSHDQKLRQKTLDQIREENQEMEMRQMQPYEDDDDEIFQLKNFRLKKIFTSNSQQSPIFVSQTKGEVLQKIQTAFEHFKPFFDAYALVQSSIADGTFSPLFGHGLEHHSISDFSRVLSTSPAYTQFVPFSGNQPQFAYNGGQYDEPESSFSTESPSRIRSFSSGKKKETSQLQSTGKFGNSKKQPSSKKRRNPVSKI